MPVLLQNPAQLLRSKQMPRVEASAHSRREELGRLPLPRAHRGAKRPWLALLLASLGLGWGVGCTQDPYKVTSLQGTGDGAVPPADGAPLGEGQVARDGASDALKDGGSDSDACQITNEGVEICDEIDNDCNGKVDDVDPKTLQDNPDHCNACGTRCARPNAIGRCVSGVCEFDREKDCAPSYYDINKNPADGCEYRCIKTNGGVEICDELDNNCDGQIDEGFDTKTNPLHCGKCNHSCSYINAEGRCVDSTCQLGPCTEGYRSVNNKDADGCEYKCPVWPVQAEQCNGKDDDCNGFPERPGDVVLADPACDTGEKGVCAAGKRQCDNGVIKCLRETEPTVEVCDEKDNDCNGKIDEGFDTQTNPLHCGKCNNVCKLPNAVPKCVAGKCAVDGCLPGFKDNDPNQPGCEHKCEVWPLSQEICDNKDNNCDGAVDEGFDTKSDPRHCGGCNKACSFPNATALCVNSTCKQGPCSPDYWDTEPTKPGCEYFCIKTNGGVERCDNADNDCDGKIDNGIDTTRDVNNCGSCGNVCRFENAAASCVNSKCVMGACTSGYKDLSAAIPGCEYKCPVWPPAANETAAAMLCDGTDNDCDGKIDEDFPTGSPCGETRGECKAGTSSCTNGIRRCDNAVAPKPEVCNNLDDDCNGTIDDGFDKLNDPRNCGGCSPCNLPHAIARCTAGKCEIAACALGWVDLDKNVPGCEYQCTATGPEICDGIDNNCDGNIDEGVALGSNPCITLGECAGATASCQGRYGWVCNYSTVGDVNLRRCTTDANCRAVRCNTTAGICPGELADEESFCDGKDNDCDGLKDEPFTNLGDACQEPGKIGACQGKGNFTCSPDRSTTVCDITSPGVAASAEKCNGLDDDCDGKVDESEADAGGPGIVGDIREINHSGMHYYIFRYEASHPGASASAAGSFTNRACSSANVLPWTDITYDQAAAACRAVSPADCGTAGRPPCWRLCSADEWRTACEGSANQVYPYGNTYGTSTCNGKDNDGYAGTPGDQDVLLPTGAKTSCVSPDSVYDMSGNVREWTNDRAFDAPAPNPDAYRVRGGAYDTSEAGLTCQTTFAVFPQSFAYSNLGFRCCRNF